MKMLCDDSQFSLQQGDQAASWAFVLRFQTGGCEIIFEDG